MVSQEELSVEPRARSMWMVDDRPLGVDLGYGEHLGLCLFLYDWVVIRALLLS